MFQIDKSLSFLFPQVTEDEKDKLDDITRENLLLREHIAFVSKELLETRSLLKNVNNKSIPDNNEFADSYQKALQMKEVEINQLSTFVAVQSTKIRDLEDKLQVFLLYKIC